jgi:tetratricopeptide (TPR) repeat protein
VAQRPTPRNGWTAVPHPPEAAEAARASPALKRAPSAIESTMSFANLPAGDARSARPPDNTVDLSLSDLSPYDHEAALRRWRLSLAALALGTLLAALGIGWFASSKARVLDEASQPTRAAAPAADAPVQSPDQGSSQLGAATRAAAAPLDPPPTAPGVQPASEAPPADKVADVPRAEGANESDRSGEPEAPRAAARAGELVDQAQALQKRKKYAPAKLRYREALTLAPDYTPALVGLVQLAIRQRDGKQAVSLAKQLASAQPEEVSHLVLLGDAYKSAHKRKEARETWRAAARKGSAEARARLKR